MKSKLREQYKELKELLVDLKVNHGAVAIKLSCEESGHSHELIDYVNNRITNGILPLFIKIGGPNAKTDIIEGLRIGVSGFIGPMIESSFGVKQYVLALQDILGIDTIDELMISVNLESLNAYKNIEEIITIPEIKNIDQIVIGSSDLAMSVSKSKTDPELIKMVREIAQKGKSIGKKIRIGGMIGLIAENPSILDKLLKNTGADRINTSNVCFEVDKINNIPVANMKALEFELKMNDFWLNLNKEKISLLEKRASTSKKKYLKACAR